MNEGGGWLTMPPPISLEAEAESARARYEYVEERDQVLRVMFPPGIETTTAEQDGREEP